jgi:hypothetical protein
LRLGFAFSPNKRVLGSLTCRDDKDSLALRSVDDWSLIHWIQLETLDARDLIWSPDGFLVAIADCQIEHRLVVVNSESGGVATFE